MSESIWEELARSPLDPDPTEESTILAKLVPLGIAVVAGLLLGLFVLGGGDGHAETTTTVVAITTSSTTTILPDPDPEVPQGYVDVAGVGITAVAAYSRGGNLYVVVNEATRSDRTPQETGGFHASHWALQGDGIEISAARAIESSLAPGVKVIEFPGVTSLPAADPNLIVRQASEMVVRTGCQGCGASSSNEASGEVALEGLERPYELAEPLMIDVGGAITMSVDHLQFTDDWGYVEWHIIDENDGRVRADIRIIFAGTDDPAVEGTNPTQLIPENRFRASQQNPTMANPQSFTRDGELLLDRVGELISAENVPTMLLLQWTVEWQHPIGEPISLSLADITDHGIID